MTAIAGYSLEPLLKAWGIDTKKIRSVTIDAPWDDVVTVTVVSLADVDPEKLNDTMTKKYTLTELLDEENKDK